MHPNSGRTVPFVCGDTGCRAPRSVWTLGSIASRTSIATREVLWIAASLGLMLTATRSTAAADRLDGVVRDSYLPGIPFLLRLDLRIGDRVDRDLWDGEITLEASDDVELSSKSVRFRNGTGSALVTATGGGDFTLTARFGDLVFERRLRNLSADVVATQSGTLAGGPLVEWSGVVHLTANVTVPAGTTLRLAPGTLVLVDGVADGEDGADLNVEGAIESLGTAEAPVTFTAADPDLAWGELDHDGASPSVYRYTHVTRAGHSPRGGHTNTGPAVRPRGGSIIQFEHSAITDHEGKAMEADDAELEMLDCLIARCVMGPEIDNTQLVFERGAIHEMFGEDDNDGIYMHSQGAGQILVIAESVVAAGDDDAIDTLRASVEIRDTIVRDFADKGISVFHDEVLVSGCVVTGNDIGVSAKSDDDSSATLTLDRNTIVDNRLGIQARDKNDEPDADIRYFVSNSIILPADVEDAAAVQTDYDPADIHIRFSNVLGGWPGEGNIDVDPDFVSRAERNFRLASSSPCIDAGDPGAELDPDGSRADMGAMPSTTDPTTPRFVRGSTNGDGDVDLSDAVHQLLHLFAGGSVSCLDAADTNDDGTVNVTDPIALLDALFRGAPVPSGPFPFCGPDPTDDDLGCESPSCE